MTRPQILVLATLAAVFAGCGGGEKAGEQAEKAPQLVIGDEQAAPASTLYQMPTPNELFSIVRQMAGEGQKRMLNPAVNADRYVSLPARSLNFGVYATDLVYASYFKLNVEVVRYYLAVKKLADKVGVAGAFTESDFMRLEANLTRGNNDSLEILSNEAYYKAYQKLQQEDMGPVLALVLAGGWVESMHLVMGQVSVFGADDPLVSRVVEQKVSLEHLLDLMEVHKADPNVAPWHAKLSAIRSIFDGLESKRTPNSGKSPSGRMVLGDDVSVTLTSEQYQQLAKAVEQLREEVVRPEDQASVKPNA
ncbi:MAG: hypothetical protein JNL05_02625 [Flavobacteriales bacterium]|nr:hypothetical protein [Flavobacteriales bacterium]